MKTAILTAILVTVLPFVPLLAIPVVFENQDDFSDFLANEDFEDHNQGVDYIFGDEEGFHTLFIVPPDTPFILRDPGGVDPGEGIRIQLREDVTINVQGHTDFGFENPQVGIRHIIEPVPNARWSEINIIGQGLGQEVSVINHCEITGGGIDNGNDNCLIKLSGAEPTLHMTSTILRDSQGCGILVLQETSEPTLNITAVEIGELFLPQTFIEDHGIFIEDQILGLTDVNITDSFIRNCNGCGFYQSLLRHQCSFELSNTSVANNAESGVKITCQPAGDFNLGFTADHSFVTDNEEFGIRIDGAYIIAPPLPVFTVTNSSQVSMNGFGGINLFNNSFIVTIENSSIEQNGFAIIPPDLDGIIPHWPRSGGGIAMYQHGITDLLTSETIHNNLVQGNAQEGLYMYHFDAFYHGTTSIRGNQFTNNGAVIEFPGNFNPGDLEDLNSLRLGAHARLNGNLDDVQLSNNYFLNGNAGVVWDHHFIPGQGGAPDIDKLIQGIRVTSNIFDNSGVGVVNFKHETANQNPPAKSLIYYNNFVGNSIAGILNKELLPNERVANNIFYGCEIGVWNLANAHEYRYCCLWNNGTDFEGNGGFGRTIEMDPLFWNDLSDNPEGWQLKWYSPLINRARVGEDPMGGLPMDPPITIVLEPDDEWRPDDYQPAVKDDSHADIGAFGGPDAYWVNDFGEVYWDPYCRIDVGYEFLSNAALFSEGECTGTHDNIGHDALESDYYRAFCTYSVLHNTTLNILPGAYFENMNLVKFKVHGRINGGDEPQINEYPEQKWIYFTGFEGEDWAGIGLYDNCDPSGYLNKVYIHNAFVGISLSNVFNTMLDHGFKIYNCSVLMCFWAGIYSYNSWVEINGYPEMHAVYGYIRDNDPDEIEAPIDEPSLFLSPINRIRSCGRSDPSGYGMKIYKNPFDPENSTISIEHTNIYDCGLARDPFTAPIYDCGIYLSDVNYPLLGRVTSARNGCSGICFYSTSMGEESFACDVFQNGHNFPQQAGMMGTEIYLMNNSMPEIEGWDIMDYEVNGNGAPVPLEEGILLYKSPLTNPLEVPAEECYWLLDEENDILDALYWDDGIEPAEGVISIAGWLEEKVDDASSFETGKGFYNEGQFRHALDQFIESIQNDCVSEAACSIRLIPLCCKGLGQDEEHLRMLIDNILDRCHRDALQIQLELLRVRSYIDEKDILHALREYRRLYDRDPEGELGIGAMVEYYHLLLGLDRDQYRIDALGSDYQCLSNLSKFENRLFELQNNLEIQEKPVDFDLLKAYPNPFNSSISIQYNLQDEQVVTISLFDLQGREIFQDTQKQSQTGITLYHYNACGLASGQYILQVSGVHTVKELKITLVK